MEKENTTPDAVSQEKVKEETTETTSKNFEKMFNDQRIRAEIAEAKAKELTNENSELKDNPVLSEVEDDGEVDTLKKDLSEVKVKLAKSEVIDKYPQLKETWDKFEEFQQESDNKGMPLNTAAKAFLTENDLLVKPRKGLEKVTGGDKTPKPTGMTVEEVTKLRTTDFKKYRDMLKKGQIKIS